MPAAGAWLPWFAEGVEEGLRRGLEQQRALLMRQIDTKFGAGAAERVEPLLARVVDAALLVEIGDVLLVADTETELVERVKVVSAMRRTADRKPATDRTGA